MSLTISVAKVKKENAHHSVSLGTSDTKGITTTMVLRSTSRRAIGDIAAQMAETLNENIVGAVH